MMKSLSPEMFDWVATNYPAVNRLISFILAIGVVVLIMKLLKAGSQFRGGRSSGGARTGFMAYVKNAKKEAQNIKEEIKDLDKDTKVTKHLIKEVHDIVKQIDIVENNPEGAAKHFNKITKDIKKIHKNYYLHYTLVSN